MTPEEIKKLVDEAVDKRLQEHERREGPPSREKRTSAVPKRRTGIGPLPEVGRDLRTETQPACLSAQPAQVVWSMPSRSSSAPKAIVGGYMDIQFRSQRQASIEAGDGRPGVTNDFDQQRFVPFIYADITEHVKIATELEIEHGDQRKL